VDWANEQDRKRAGLDVRGADLRKVDLDQLPLTKLRAGLTWDETINVPAEKCKMATVLMDGANLKGAQLERANLREAQLERANLREAQLGDKERIGPRLADVQWGVTNLAIVDWSQVKKLGDEWEAEQKKELTGEMKELRTRLDDYQVALRANRQLAVSLQAQGLNEIAARFAYRAQLLQRIALRLQIFLPRLSLWRRIQILGSYIFSSFLDLLASYGYHPAKTVFWYLFVIGGFATAYAIFGHLPPLPDALVFSFMSFHGRGFFPSLTGETNLHNPLVVLAAAEAVMGLFIEISFIATFTQRFFGK
jgi:hypothetical protein